MTILLPFTGIAKLMEPLGKNLNAKVYCLQYGNRNFTITDNTEKLAENWLTVSLKYNVYLFFVHLSYINIIQYILRRCPIISFSHKSTIDISYFLLCFRM